MQTDRWKQWHTHRMRVGVGGTWGRGGGVGGGGGGGGSRGGREGVHMGQVLICVRFLISRYPHRR